jgi:hypothetical protein
MFGVDNFGQQALSITLDVQGQTHLQHLWDGRVIVFWVF